MTQQINLFNPIFRKQKKYFSSVTMVQALAIIIVACSLLAIDAAFRMRALAQQAAATEALLAASQQRLTVVKVQFAPRQKSPTLAAEIKAAQEELAMLRNATATVQRGGFGDTLGFSGYFRAMARQSIAGLWLTEVNVASGGAVIGIQGNVLQAPLVPQYMARLAQEPVMKGKSFATLAMDAVSPPKVVMAGGAGAPVAVSTTPVYLKFSLQSVGSAPGTAVAK
ncbi:MAG: hypothetical protein WKG03_18360 [Telluria sp.]